MYARIILGKHILGIRIIGKRRTKKLHMRAACILRWYMCVRSSSSACIQRLGNTRGKYNLNIIYFLQIEGVAQYISWACMALWWMWWWRKRETRHDEEMYKHFQRKNCRRYFRIFLFCPFFVHVIFFLYFHSFVILRRSCWWWWWQQCDVLKESPTSPYTIWLCQRF